MLIKQLLSGRKRSSFVIVKDNLRYNGFPIIYKFIEENDSRCTRIHLLLSEITKTDIKASENIITHRYFPDPWNLLEGREAELTFEQIVNCILNERDIYDKTNILFVIDSIASLLQFVSLHTLCTYLKKIIDASKREDKPSIQILCLLHSDLLPDECKEYKHLTFMANTLITCPQGSIAGNNTAEIDLEHHQSNGKILKETYTCCYGPKKELQFEVKLKPKENTQATVENVVNTTFKLTLEEKEKESRSQVVLPYLKASNTNDKGRIFYEPDVNDDWDDEDPDDDLEI